MYWNNPLIQVSWPGQRDVIKESLHSGAHAVFWNPAADYSAVKTNQRLQDLCDWANRWLHKDGLDAFIQDVRNHYDIANLVKLNLWIHDIREQGIVKPWLLQDQGDGSFLAGTGDSRLRCLEILDHIKTVPAFVCTRQDRADLYQQLEPVTDFDRFAQICGAVQGQDFLFRLTDPQAPYGLYWYEYNSERTRRVTPGEAQAVAAFYHYAQSHCMLEITPAWFDLVIEWELNQVLDKSSS